MKIVGAAVVSSVLAASGAVAQDAVQWRVEDGGNGHWYRRVPLECWSDGRAYAMTQGADLASLTSVAEAQHCAQLLNTSNYSLTTVIGGRRDALADLYSGWTWVDGETFVPGLLPWMSGNPGCCGSEEYFLGLNYIGQIGDLPECGGIGGGGAIVEWSADCNGDGIVDYGQIRAGDLDDANSNNIPDCCETGTACNCAGDVDDSGAVNGVDLAAILNVWGTSGGKYPGADCNGDGVVDAVDLSIVLNAWGPCD